MLIWEGVRRVRRACRSGSLQKRNAAHVALGKFITEGHEKADEPAKEGAMLDGEDVAQVRAVTIQQEREEFYAAWQHAASFHCLVEEWNDCEEL